MATRNGPSETRRRGRSALRTLLWVIGGLAAAVVLLAVLVAALVDGGALVARVRDQVLPRVSERLGREVAIERIDVDLFPMPTARLEGVRVEGVGEHPLIAADAAVARLDLWTLIRTLGKEVAAESVELRGAEVTLVRMPDGTWSHEPVVERLRRPEAGGRADEPAADRRWAVERVRVRDGLVRIVDRSAPGGAATGVLRGIDATASHLAPGEPMTLELQAALQGDARNVRAALTVDPLPVGAGLGPDEYPAIAGTVSVDDAPLGTLRNVLPGGLAQIATGGSLRLRTEVETREGRYHFSGDGGVNELLLRGEPARASFTFAGSMDPAKEGSLRVDVDELSLRGPGVELDGSAEVAVAPLRVGFALDGPLLDLQRVAGLMPEEERAAGEPLLPPSIRRRIQAAEVEGTLRAERLVNGNLTATDFASEVELRDGVLTLREARAGFYGGTLRADGTTVNLAEPQPSWNLRGAMEGVRLGEAMQEIAGVAPVGGTLASDLALRGAGVDWPLLEETLDGTARLELAEGRLAGADLEGLVASRLAEGLRRIGLSGVVPEGGAAGTALGTIRAHVVVEDGWMRLRRPLSIPTSFGALELRGRIGLSRQLQLSGAAKLSPEWVAQASGGARRGAVEIPLGIGGTLEAPAVSGLDAEALARALLPTGEVERRAEQELEGAERRARREAQRRLDELLGR